METREGGWWACEDDEIEWETSQTFQKATLEKREREGRNDEHVGRSNECVWKAGEPLWENGSAAVDIERQSCIEMDLADPIILHIICSPTVQLDGRRSSLHGSRAGCISCHWHIHTVEYSIKDAERRLWRKRVKSLSIELEVETR